MSDHLKERVSAQSSEIIELREMIIQKDEELETRADQIGELRRQLEERDQLIGQLLANTKHCSTCGQKLVSQVEQMETL